MHLLGENQLPKQLVQKIVTYACDRPWQHKPSAKKKHMRKTTT
jgi:hypothetical protein